MSGFAEVALPIAVNKTFTYLVPPDLAPVTRIGVRVIVPFGPKYSTGVVIGIPRESDIESLRPIKDVIDSSPILDDHLLSLCFWISDYYMAPIGEVLKAALPQGFSPSSRRLVSTPRSGIPPLDDLTPQRRKLLQIIREKGTLPVKELARKTRFRNIHAVLNEMANRGYVSLEEQINKPRRQGKTARFILLEEISESAIEEAMSSLSPRRHKAKMLLQTVSDLHSSGIRLITQADLVQRAGVSSSSLKEFKESGLLPTGRREVEMIHDLGSEAETLSITLNEAQTRVLTSIQSALDGSEQKTFLLHGVTGSGKTQVYIEAIRLCLNSSRGAIVLVPEISLTPQIVRRFNTHFPGNVAVVHSRMSPSERFDVWRRTSNGEYHVVIGPRSALFAPVGNLGLIVVDEEHEASYKQYDSVPRYHARDAALMRARLSGAVAVLGSATPSIESCYNAETGKYTLLELPDRVDAIPMPVVSILDMREERKRQKGKGTEFKPGAISETLKAKIEERLDRKEGVILLQNRRGFAPYVECLDCGYSESCEHCSVTLTYHQTKQHLRCHYCGTVYSPHDHCPECRGETMLMKGIGTQRVEEELHELFPDGSILRMDLDTTTRKGAHERILRSFADGKADILLGTQMVAKGLDFPRVTLVGVVSADTQMLLPDFRSAERTFQLLTQVAGRAGRSRLKGEVVIQTYQPEHYALKHVLDHDYDAFYDEEISYRNELEYPPFSRIVLIEMKGEKEDMVRKEAERFSRIIAKDDGTFTILGPAPAVIPRINRQFRWQIIIKSPRAADPSGAILRTALRNSLGQFSNGRSAVVRVIVDVDPVGML